MKDIGISRRKKITPLEESGQKAKIKSKRIVETPFPDASSSHSSKFSVAIAWSLGSGRMDPFACYPTPLDQELLFLDDHVNTSPDIELWPFKDIIDVAATCFLDKLNTMFPLLEVPDDSSMPSVALPWPIPPALNRDHSIWKHSFLNEYPLLPIFHDMTTLMLTLKSDSFSHRTSNGPSVVVNRAAVFSLVSRLDEISIPVENTTADNLIQECCRIAGMLLLGAVYDHFPSRGFPHHVNRFMDTASLSRKLHTILCRLEKYKHWILYKPLLLWCLTLGAVSSESLDDTEDFLDLMLFAGRWLGLRSWMEALLVAGNLFWVGEIFDEKYKRVTACKEWKYNTRLYYM
ncbi:hypothetical protein ONS96_000552 [Cadophora gregata f. sp. sojae]|nr:hypothetical protein ONS96_000552 [Cadophora gregata f. sp. sojae]